MSKDRIEVICVGAVNVDRLARFLDHPVAGTSNPGDLAVRPGGVARNVAAQLIRYGHQVALVSAVGDDNDGKFLLHSLQDIGLDTSHIQVVKDCSTATYAALFDPDGQLYIGHAAMDIYKALTVDMLAGIPCLREKSAIWLVDANLPPDSLVWLADQAEVLFADTVSVAKAPKLAPILTKLSMLVCNRQEAAALVGRNEGESVAALAEALLSAGCVAAVVTDGAETMAIADGNGVHERQPPRVEVADVNGAGDAMIAGTIEGYLTGLSSVEAVQVGIDRAADAVIHEGAP